MGRRGACTTQPFDAMFRKPPSMAQKDYAVNARYDMEQSYRNLIW